MNMNDNFVLSNNHRHIMSDRNKFNKMVYTPLSEALLILDKRQKDPKIKNMVQYLLKDDIPPVLNNKKCGIFARHIATPDYDTQRFIKLTTENNLDTVLLEYLDDKFVSGNKNKHALCQIRINNGLNNKGDYIFEKINIIDFVKNDGQKIKDINTLWDEPLNNFHKKLFNHYDIKNNLMFYDLSDWYRRNGKNAKKYYKKFLLFFITHGILFENFSTKDSSENIFTENILLPAIYDTINMVGMKPLIVPMEPIESENEEYWISHPPLIKTCLFNK
jgi:hypothetical protein